MIKFCIDRLLIFTQICILCVVVVSAGGLLSACGGGSSNGTDSLVSSSASAISLSSRTSTSSSTAVITISGNISYDFVPHFSEKDGLDYSKTTALPGRGLVVELLNANNQILATDISNETGGYSFSIARNELVRVRVKAQILNEPGDAGSQWNFKVTDNTNNNRLYSMVGALLVANESSAIRDLHASSGWVGSAYTQPRGAAPFAIIDSIFTGVQRLVAVDNTIQFPALELRWSSNNNTADGELSLGEIATSFYRQDLSAIYILGSEDDDTDEYDRHVILHEWGHYIEAELSRSDSIGGDHHGDDSLDLRVAMSEGFANAFSAMMLDDPLYRDSSGTRQNDGFRITVNRINNSVRGWYSEASVQSILYNFYVSNGNRAARDLSDIFTVITHEDYIGSDTFVTIYLFAERLRAIFPSLAQGFNQLLAGQNIAITDRFGANESNSGGYATHLPIYKSLPLNNTAINVCSSNRLGFYNKLGVSQFLLLNVLSKGRYQITAKASDINSGDSDPDLYLYKNGALLHFAEDISIGEEALSYSLDEDIYLLEVVDARAVDGEFFGDVYACFDIRALQQN